jgi:hypothetical protein
MMRISCTQCNKTLKECHADDLSQHLFFDDGTYFFCNIACKDEWDCLDPPERESYNPQQQWM